MFDKYRAVDLTKVYLNKYEELRTLMKAKEAGKVGESLMSLHSLLNVYIEPTNRCNLKCSFCVRNHMDRVKHRLSLTDFKQIVDTFPTGSYFSLAGNGEPLLNPEIYDMITYAEAKGMWVAIITNASALSEQNRSKLVQHAPTRVQLSFQSIDKETNERIMRGSKFGRELQNILEFILLVRKTALRTLITISRVDFAESAASADATRIFWGKMPIDNYFEGPLLSIQTGSEAYDPVSMDGPYSPCANPWDSLKINADGTVNPCAHDYNSLYVIGNIREDPLIDIINSPKAKRFREAVLTGDMEFLDSIGYHCGKCNTWTKQVGGSIPGLLEQGLPVRLGLVINELSGDRPSDTAFLEQVLDYLKTGKTDILSHFHQELYGDGT